MKAQTSIECQIVQLVAQTAARSAPEIDLDTTLTDLGMDSLDMVNLFVTLEKAFKIEYHQTRCAQIETVGDLIKETEQTALVALTV